MRYGRNNSIRVISAMIIGILIAIINYWVEVLVFGVFIILIIILWKLILWKTKEAPLKIPGKTSPDIKDGVVRSNWDKIAVKDISSFGDKLTEKDFIMSYVDENGYERNHRGRLIHRVITYRFIYNKSFPNKFSTYQVHHKDENKRNNHPRNLQILTDKEHKKIHGIL